MFRARCRVSALKASRNTTPTCCIGTSAGRSTRIHGTTKRQVRAMFEQERPHLLPLPPTRFEYYRVAERTVHFDGFIEVEGAYYHAPPHYVGTKVTVHIGRLWVRIIDPRTHQLLREHAVTGKGQRRIVEADLPKQTPPKVLDLIARIAHFGPTRAIFARAVENERGALGCAYALWRARSRAPLRLRRSRTRLRPRCRCAELATTAFSARTSPTIGPCRSTTHHKIIPGIDTYAQHFAFLTEGEPHDN